MAVMFNTLKASIYLSIPVMHTPQTEHCRAWSSTGYGHSYWGTL